MKGIKCHFKGIELTREEIEDYEQSMSEIEDEMQPYINEQEAAIKSGDTARIVKAGITFNEALLKLRQQKPDLFS